MSSNKQVAFLGLGNIGRGMVKNIVGKGPQDKPLIIYNRTLSKADKLAGQTKGPIIVAKTLDEAVSKSDIIFTCVGDDSAIEHIIQSAIAGSDVAGKIFVDCSTIHPDTTRNLEKILKEKKAYFVAMPVFGAPAMADAGQLVCVLAGPAEQTDQIKPFIKGVVGRAIIDYSGQEVGKATHLKIIGNTMVLQMVEALSEGHVLAEKSGLGTDNFHAFIEAMFPGPYTAYSTRLKSGDYYQREEPLFAVDLARKDARHAFALAKEAGMRLKAVEVADQHLEAVKNHAGAKGDIAAIYGAVRKESGLPYENQ